ncbi:Colorectal mutant cancer protein [Apis mellifera carnica]|nr:Colorectal mutant cancer protein [Apis mellifera carnica]
MSQTADAESEAGSICDEERVRKLFQACDGDGDGFIDSQDLLTVCRELNLENSVEELMRELGADEHGRISYQEFLRCRLALRPEIEALRSGKHRTSPHHTHTPEYLPTSSDNSLGTISGRHERWEFDSGARDLSPEPHTLQKLVEAAAGGTGNMLDLANKQQQHCQQAIRYTVQPSHVSAPAGKEILEPPRRDLVYVHCATTEEDEDAEEEEEEEPKGLTRSRSWLCCPADHSSDRTVPIQVEASHRDKRQESLHAAALSSLRSEVAELNARLVAETRAREATEAALVRAELQAARAEQKVEQQAARHEERLTELHSVIAELGRQLERHRATVIAEEDESEWREQLDSPAALPTPEPTQQAASCQSVAVAALQEEVTALRAEIASLQAQLANFKNQANNQRQQADSESPRREARATRGNTSSPEPLSAPCSPLLPPLQTPPTKSVTREEVPVLKIAERVRLRRTDERHITGPDITNLGVCSTMVAEHLVSDLLEHSNIQELNGSEKQFEVETERLNSRLEHARTNNAVLALTLHESKAQCDRSEVTWCVEDEQRLRRHISRLKGERAMVRSTVVELESVHAEPLNSKNTISLAEARKLDLETAVLMQELMAMREDKAELRARVFLLEKERATIELKLNARDTQIAAQHAAIEHLQGQLRDTEAMLAMATNKDRGLSDNESEGMESELIEALGREARLKERLQELVSTLDKVNKNSELRHQQSAELINDLKRANGALVQTLEKSKKKYQSRLKKLEQQMLGMVERHAAQV